MPFGTARTSLRGARLLTSAAVGGEFSLEPAISPSPINARLYWEKAAVPRRPHASVAASRPAIGDTGRRSRAAEAARISQAASPFLLEDVEQWIASVRERPDLDGYVSDDQEGSVIGAAELRGIDLVHRQAEASFWLRRENWGRVTGFEGPPPADPDRVRPAPLNRVYAYHMARNPASGAVMAHCGFQSEGCLRERVWKLDRSEDAMPWSRLASDPLSGAEHAG